ncbi:MAG TPA: FtsX-like permease family protein [Acidimicrobiia bacterium]
MTVGWRALWRQLASTPAVAIGISVSVLLSVFLLAAAPRLLELVADEDLRATVSEPEPAQRNIRVERLGRIGAGPAGDPFRSVRDTGDAFASSEIPPALSGVIPSHYYLVDSPRFEVAPMPGEDMPHPFPVYLRYRYQEGIEERVELVSGQLPQTQEPVAILVGEACPEEPDEQTRLIAELAAGTAVDIDCVLTEAPHFQVAVSASTAEAMGLEIGRQVVLTPDPTDRLVFGLSGDELGYRFVMSISGIIAPDDLADEYWYGDPSLHQPAIRENADLRVIYATGLMAPDDYGPMLALTGEAGRSYVWRHFVDPDLVVATGADTLQAELTPFQLQYPAVSREPTDYTVVTQLSGLLEAHQAQRSQTVSLLSLSVAGLFAVVISVVAVLSVLMTRRQHAAIVLTRGRGASAGQLFLTRLYGALLLVIPAASIGYLVAAVVFPDTGRLVSYRVTVILAIVIVACLVCAGVTLFVAPLGLLRLTSPAVPPRGSTRRVVVETLVWVVAAGSVLLLRRRGQAEPADLEFDLLLALAPSLVVVAVALLLVRVYPHVVSVLALLASRARGLVTFVGLRRIRRMDFGSNLPLVAIVVCVATATYASMLSTSIVSGQIATSWHQVGGDYAVKGFGPDVALPTSIDFDALGSWDHRAMGQSFADAIAIGVGGRHSAEALAIDAGAYAELTSGTPGDIALPSFMFETPGEDAGTDANPVPVIVSDTWPGGFDLVPGDVFTLNLGPHQFTVVAGEVRDRYPDIPPDRPFVVLSLAAMETALGGPAAPTVAYLAATEDAGAELAANLAAQAPSARLISRYENLAAVAGDPFIRWGVLGSSVVFWSAALFAVVAAVSAFSILSAPRRRDLAYLRTVGLDSGQALAVTLLEQLPGVLVGTVVGVGAGLLAAVALGPALDLSAFTGGLAPTEVGFAWGQLVILATGLIGALGIAVVMFSVVRRRDELTAILRVGDQP